MPYAVKPIAFKPHRLNGLSGRLLESHYENEYGGAGGDPSGPLAAALRARGLDVLSLEGGILAWRAMGHPTEPIESERESGS